MNARGLLIGAAAGAGALVLMMRPAFASAPGSTYTFGDAAGDIDEYGEGYPIVESGEAGSFGSLFGSLTGESDEVYSDMIILNADQNVNAFLKMLRVGEGTADEGGYNRMVGGGMFISYADHPRKRVKITFRNGKSVWSSAAGAYQILEPTWDGVQRKLALPDFSPASQDAAAVELIRGRGALADVRAGRIEEAIRKCNREWASLPGSPYGQPTVQLADAIANYAQQGGTIA